MTTLIEKLPTLVNEFEVLLKAINRQDIANQLKEVELVRYSYDSSCGAMYIYLSSPKTLNIIETNVIGTKHGETISIDHALEVCFDTDNFGRLTGIEILEGLNVAAQL